MKKLLIALALLSSASLFSGEITVKGKAGFYFPNSERMRDVYGGGLIYGPEVAWRFLKIFDLWGDSMFFSKGGRSLGDRQRTRVWIRPVGVGLNIVVPIANVLEVYAGGGPRYFALKIRNTSKFVNKKVGKSGWGGCGRIGIAFHFPKCFLWDIYFNYSRKSFEFSEKSGVGSHSLDIGGTTIGTALGYRF